MQCPYRNMAKESGCDLVDDLSGIAGAVAREFCDFRHCQECPLFQEALHENIRVWCKEEAEHPHANDTPLDFWKLTLKQGGYR